MIYTLLTITLLGLIAQASSIIDGLYVNTFGDKRDPAIVFIHGGPGHNSFDFEASTANKLSQKGFFVVTYDGRGQGRSVQNKPAENDFTFKSYVYDLKKIVDVLEISRFTILGYSFGGAIGLSFIDMYPAMVTKLILVSAPIFYPEVFKSMLELCAKTSIQNKFYKGLENTMQLYQTGFPASEKYNFTASFVGQAFYFGGLCGAYVPKNKTDEAKRVERDIASTTIVRPVANNDVNIFATTSFISNENYAELSWDGLLLKHKKSIFGIYGDSDGLFNSLHIGHIQTTLPFEQFEIIDNASHAVYLHQQSKFLDIVFSY